MIFNGKLFSDLDICFMKSYIDISCKLHTHDSIRYIHTYIEAKEPTGRCPTAPFSYPTRYPLPLHTSFRITLSIQHFYTPL